MKPPFCSYYTHDRNKGQLQESGTQLIFCEKNGVSGFFSKKTLSSFFGSQGFCKTMVKYHNQNVWPKQLLKLKKPFVNIMGLNSGNSSKQNVGG